MKVVAFNGSARPKGNTSLMIKAVFNQLEKAGIETELVSLAGERVRGCIACRKCFENKDKKCILKDDIINSCIEKMCRADGMIMASPTYFTDVSTEMKALIDRAGMVGVVNDSLFKRKVGTAVVAVRRAGAVHTFETLNNFFFISQIIVPGSNYWNMGIGLKEGQVLEDEEGMKTMEILGENMAWLLQKIN